MENRSKLSPTSQIPDHRGQQRVVEAAYRMEEHLAQQPAHIAAQRAREFKQATTALRRQWNKTEVEFHLQSPLHPLLAFRTQFRTSSGRITSIDPRQGHRRGPTGAELAENELKCQQAVDFANAAENETQEVIVVRRDRAETTRISRSSSVESQVKPTN